MVTVDDLAAMTIILEPVWPKWRSLLLKVYLGK